MQFTWRRLVEISFALLTLTALGIVGDREKRYCIIDLSGGEYASCYPVSYVDSPQCGFWSDDFKTTKMVMRKIDPEKFRNGLTNELEVRKSFYIGVYEVTQRQYELVTGCNPSSLKGARRPVVDVSWEQIRGNPIDLRRTDSESVEPNSFMGRLSARAGFKVDLPTATQWEYACRAGKSCVTNDRKPDRELLDCGRFAENAVADRGGYFLLASVGSYMPNAWGLYDMCGNAWEWCLDRCDAWCEWDTNKVPGATRVLRGGGWRDSMKLCTPYSSCFLYAQDRMRGLIYGPDCDSGFRVVAWPDHRVRSTIDKPYCIVDLSVGKSPDRSRLSFADRMPEKGWCDEEKTSKLVMRKIEPGKFLYGGKSEIEIRQSFYIGIFEVTQGQYAHVMGVNPAKEWSEMCKVGEIYPVCFVSWDDARGGRDAQQFKSMNRDSFAGRLSHLTGRRFDLPTKEQWEYVCRAGTKTRYNCGEDAPYNSMCLLGWSEERHSGMKPVGMRNPNRWGIYDMHGNMWEWCLDRYCDKSRQVLNDVVSHCEDTSSSILRVLRGGAYSKMAEDCDSCSRNQSPQSNEFGNDIGFRVVMRVEDDEDEEGWRGK